MAKKVKAPAVASQASAAGDDDLVILNPHQAITIAGRAIVVREYGFVEGLRLQPLTQPIMDALFEAVGGGSPPELELVLGILASHYDALIALICASADVDAEWIHSLGQDDGYALMLTWWTVNGPFFIRRVVQRQAAQRAVENLRAGQTSTPPSLPPDMEAPTPSGE